MDGYDNLVNSNFSLLAELFVAKKEHDQYEEDESNDEEDDVKPVLGDLWKETWNGNGRIKIIRTASKKLHIMYKKSVHAFSVCVGAVVVRTNWCTLKLSTALLRKKCSTEQRSRVIGMKSDRDEK